MSQLMAYGLTIIKNTNNSETGTRTWIMRQINKYAWPNLKNHSEEAHHVLRAVRGTKLRSAAYHHANSLDYQFLSEVKSV